MAGPWDLTGQNIENTYQRILQTPDGTSFYDGTGSLVTLPSANTASLLTTASATGNTITFTKGDGSTFPVTVAAGTGNPGGSNQTLQFNSSSVFSGSNNLKFDYTTNNILLTGSLLVSQSHISSVDYIDFQLLDTAQQPVQNEGRLFWNSDSKTLQLDLEQNFHTDLNQQLILRVVNKTNSNLPIGTVVYISGSQGNRPGIATASWTGDQTSAATLGFTAKAINNNNNGYVITRGILDGVNTAAYSPGTQLYLSASGQYTNIPPDAPLHEVRLGKVIVQDATVGSIYVDIMNGYELTELHDVKTNGVVDGDLLMYSSSLWINSKTLSGSYTLSGSLTTNDGISVQSLTASFISASSITGSLFGTASWAQSASQASTASYYQVFPYTGSAIISGSLSIVSGSTRTFAVTESGVTVLGALTTPPAVVGGIYFDGTDFFLGY